MAEHSATLSSDGLDYLPSGSAAEKRSLAKWYAAAKLALARNRPLTTAVTPLSGRHCAAEFSATELDALRGVGAFKDDVVVGADNDPLIGSQAQYMALLEESLSAAEAAKLLRVDVSRVRQRLRERSLLAWSTRGTGACRVFSSNAVSSSRVSPKSLKRSRRIFSHWMWSIGSCYPIRNCSPRRCAPSEPSRMAAVGPGDRARGEARQ